jgi:hypothetical protein
MTIKSSLMCGAALTCLVTFSVCHGAAQAQQTDISSTVNIDAGATYEVREETYTLPDAQLPSAPVDLPPEWEFHPEMIGLVVSPVNATGPRPVALFIHGQALTCYDPTTDTAKSAWPCAEGSQPVPSYRGFLAYQRYLAARGWVTLSISGNGISGHIFAESAQGDTPLRAELAEKHLEQWALWLTGDTTLPPPAFITAGVQPDLQQLLLIGHSRGGSAVNQVATRSLTESALPWRARAQVLIGPVAVTTNRTPTLPTVVLLPGCDGDVLNLQGQSYIDRGRDLSGNAALRSAVFIHGANHKFFNSEWDPDSASIRVVGGDDAEELFESRTPHGACRPGAPERLSGEAQRELGLFYVAAAGKAFVQSDPNVLPLLDGSPVCAGPTCRANIQTQALGGDRQPVLIPSADGGLTASEQVTIAQCNTATEAEDETACITPDMPTIKTVTRTPHFNVAVADDDLILDPSRVALRMQWTTAAGGARMDTSHQALSSDARSIVMRVIADPEGLDTSFAVSLIDTAGNSLPLGPVQLRSVPAGAGAGIGVYWAQEVRFPIDVEAAAAAGFAVNALQSVEIAPQSANGKLWLLDVWSTAGSF